MLAKSRTIPRLPVPRRAGHATDTGDSAPGGIDRIILYIDDLDRCPPERVVAMLEAVHLLPAIELFVAVDPRWLLRAVAAHYRDVLDAPATRSTDALADPHEEQMWRSTPARYLEKIFQVVLTLPPLDTSGYERLLHTLVGSPDRTTPALTHHRHH
jgi:predicted KAP-like P-loop ATPase